MTISNFIIQILYIFIFKYKKSFLRIVLAIMLILNISSKITAQTVFCPPNINFENGNLTNWQFFTGTCCPIIANTSTTAINGRHTLMSGTGTDPYGNFPVVAPDGGNYSLKLGNNIDGAQAERARYFIRIPAGVNNYKLIFKYAVVFQDPQHIASEQPRFTVSAVDSATNAPLSCVNFNFVATSSLPGFVRVGATDVYYKNWSSANLDLSGYGGKTIAVNFSTGDCDQGGHFGYGYVDVNCDEFKASVISCKGNPISTLIGPSGFTEYKWYDSTFSTLLGSNQVLNISTPTVFNKFKLITKPYPTFGCADTITTIVRISDLKLNLQKDTLVCGSNPIQLTNTATVSSFFQPITYNWSPANGLSCTNCLNPILTPLSNTKYVLTTTDVNGCVQKDSFTVTLRLNIISQPKDISVCPDSTAKFKVIVNSSLAFTYQWKKNGVNIIGANADSLIISNASYNDTANYSVLVTANCDSVLSSTVKLKIFKPIFVKQPISLLQCPNSRAVFKTSVTGDTNVTYQWFKRGTLITGANKDSLVINNVTNADTGFYYLKVNGKCTSTVSDTVRLTISSTIVINQQPQPILQCRNTIAVFKVKAIGPGTLNYIWRKGNNIIAGQTKDSLVLNNINYADSGNYSVEIRSLCDTVFSNIVKLSVLRGSTILNQPKSVSLCKDSNTQFKVIATGYGNISYQWKKNGVNIIGANADSLVITNANFNDSANYTVLVSSYCDSLLSNIAKLKVYMPIFVKQPNSLIQCSGSKAVFKATVNNDTNIIYQWLKNGIPVLGANKDSLILNNINNSDTGFYQLKATGKCLVMLSDTVNLSLYKNTVITSQPQVINQCINTRATFYVKATGDGVVTYQWRKGNTNLIGQTADSLVINNINYSDTGNYSVRIKSLCDSVTSNTVKLTIIPSTKITLQPQSITQCINTRAVLKAKATGFGTVTYQWQKNDIDILNATFDSLVINSIQSTDSGSYRVIIKSYCDSVISQNARIDLHPFPQPNLPPITYLCVEVGKIGVSGFKSQLWSTGDTTPFTNIFSNGNYWVKVTDNNSCVNFDTTQVLLNSLPLVYAGIDTVLCNELTLRLNGSAINYDSIFWRENTDGTFDNNKLFATKFTANTNKIGMVTLVFNGVNRCGVAADSLTVQYTPKPSADFELSDTLVCQGSPPVKLTPTDNAGFFAGPFVFNGLFTPEQSGLFQINYIISRNFCNNNNTKSIVVVPQPIANFSYQSSNPDIDQSVLFTSESKNELTYLWNFDNGITSTLKNTSYHFTEEGFYKVSLTAFNRICLDTISKMVHIKGSKNIFIPNAFTPNQNGLNEEFKVLYKNSKGAVLNIYNRWGQLIFTSNNVNKGWDGTFEGNPCQEDVYYYIVDYTNNDDEVRQLKGNFTLIR